MILHTCIAHDPRRTLLNLRSNWRSILEFWTLHGSSNIMLLPFDTLFIWVQKAKGQSQVWSLHHFRTITLILFDIQPSYLTHVAHELRRTSVDFWVQRSRSNWQFIFWIFSTPLSLLPSYIHTMILYKGVSHDPRRPLLNYGWKGLRSRHWEFQFVSGGGGCVLFFPLRNSSTNVPGGGRVISPFKKL